MAFCMFTRGYGVFTPWRQRTTMDAQVPLQEQPPRNLRRLAHVRPRSPSLGAAGEVVNGERAESDWWGRHLGFVEGIYWDFIGFNGDTMDLFKATFCFDYGKFTMTRGIFWDFCLYIEPLKCDPNHGSTSEFFVNHGVFYV